MTLRARLLAALVVIVAVLGAAEVSVTRMARASLVDQLDRQLVAASPVAMGAADRRGGGGPFFRELTNLYVGTIDASGERQALIMPGLTGAGEGEPRIATARIDAALRALPPSDGGPGGPIDPAARSGGAPAAGAPASGSSVGPSPSSQAGPGQPFVPKVFEALSSTGAAPFRVLLIPRPAQQGLVVVAISTASILGTYHRLLWASGLATMVLLGVLGIVAAWVVRLGLRPIRQVTETANAIADGDLDRRVEASTGPTEAGRLGHAFNLMVSRRQAAEERLRQFVADASHELRTPLTSIRGYVELYRQGGIAPGAELDDALRRVGREAHRMSALVDDLLLLARLDQGRPLDHQKVSLSELVTDAVVDASAAHPSRRLGAAVEDDLTVEGDASRLRQVVTNLVANALTHTPEGTSVTVTAHGYGDVCVIEVLDDGPGMSAEVAEHVFDRFYRADGARNRTGGPGGGSGLGLSIVKSIVEAHGGRVGLETAPAAGACFRVVLRRDRSPLAQGGTAPAPAPVATVAGPPSD